MLNLDRGRALDPQHQGCWLAAFRIARPLHADRLGIGGDLAADDLGPMGDDLTRRKTLAGERIGQAFVEKLGQWARVRCGGACSRAFGSATRSVAMTLAGTSVRRKRAARRAARGRSARLVRSPSPQAAVARRARARHPSRIGYGSPKSCCSRRQCGRSRPITRASWTRFPTVERTRGGGARRRAQTVGRARLLRTRPQPARLRTRWSSRTARRALSAAPKRRSPNCRGSAPTRRRRLQRSRSISARRPSTAMSSA